jgi:hypothetical protein
VRPRGRRFRNWSEIRTLVSFACRKQRYPSAMIFFVRLFGATRLMLFPFALLWGRRGVTDFMGYF